MRVKLTILCVMLSITLSGQDYFHTIYSNPDNSLINPTIVKIGSGFLLFGHDTYLPQHFIFFTIDSLGEIVSSKNIPSNDFFVTSVEVKELSNEGFIFLGQINVPVEFHPFTFLVKFNSDGNLIWAKQRFPTTGPWLDEIPKSFVITENESFVVSGYWDELPEPSKRISLLKFTTNGIASWGKSISYGTEAISNSIAKTSSGGFLLTGYLKLAASSNKELFLIKTDSVGTPFLYKYYDTDYDLEGKGIVELPDGGCIIIAEQFSQSWNKEIFIIRTDSLGNKIWAKTVQGVTNNPDTPTRLALTSNSDIIITGTTKDFGFNNSNSAFLMRMGIAGNLKWFVNYFDSSQTQNDIEIYGNDVKNLNDTSFIMSGTKTISNGQQTIHKIIFIKTDSLGQTDCYFQYQNVTLNDVSITSSAFIPVVEDAGFTTTNTAPPFSDYTLFMEYPCLIPVELSLFVLSYINGKVELNWKTLTETNNLGFYILRKNNQGDWQNIGFTEGYGTTTEIQNYTFTDEFVTNGKYQYRLKQIDFNGTYKYSEIVEVIIAPPANFRLQQNYPNPFNPSTTIKYQIPELSFVTITVYDVLGNEIATLVNEEKPAGSYEVEFNGSDLTSGIYFYTLIAWNYSNTKKLVILK